MYQHMLYLKLVCLNLKIFLTTLCSRQNLMKNGFILCLVTYWKNDFEKLEHFPEILKPANFRLIGDLNARISEEQVLDSELLIDLPYICNTRSSRDKTLNTEDMGGIVLNGR